MCDEGEEHLFPSVFFPLILFIYILCEADHTGNLARAANILLRFGVPSYLPVDGIPLGHLHDYWWISTSIYRRIEMSMDATQPKVRLATQNIFGNDQLKSLIGQVGIYSWSMLNWLRKQRWAALRLTHYMVKSIVGTVLLLFVATAVSFILLWGSLSFSMASSAAMRQMMLAKVPGSRVFSLDFNAMPIYTEAWRSNIVDDALHSLMPPSTTGTPPCPTGA